MRSGDIKRKLVGPKSDPQRPLFYELEHELDGGAWKHSAPEKHLRKLMKSICRYYRLPVPRLKIAQSKEKTCGWMEVTIGGSDYAITLNRQFHGQNVLTLLHELAHYIVDFRFNDRESHGKEFAAVYMHLLHRTRVLPQDAFKVIARRWGIKIAREYLRPSLKPRA